MNSVMYDDYTIVYSQKNTNTTLHKLPVPTFPSLQTFTITTNKHDGTIFTKGYRNLQKMLEWF